MRVKRKAPKRPSQRAHALPTAAPAPGRDAHPRNGTLASLSRPLLDLTDITLKGPDTHQVRSGRQQQLQDGIGSACMWPHSLRRSVQELV